MIHKTITRYTLVILVTVLPACLTPPKAMPAEGDVVAEFP